MPKNVPDTTVLTEEQKEFALEMAANNKSLKTIAKELGFTTPMQFVRYRKRDPLFQSEFNSARQFAAECLADSALTVVDDYDNPLKAKTQFEVIKWVCATRYPEVFGERLDLNVRHEVDISAALGAAMKRVLRDDVEPIEIEAKEIK